MNNAKKTARPSRFTQQSLLLLFFLLFAAIARAQDPSATDDPKGAGDMTPAQKKYVKAQKAREKSEQKKYQAALKQHEKDQTKDVRKRMKKDAGEAKHNNDHTKEFFLKRWFEKKPAK